MQARCLGRQQPDARPPCNYGPQMKESVRLLEGSKDTGHIQAAAEERAVEALKRMKKVAESKGAPIRALATSALREAKNRERILRRIKVAPRPSLVCDGALLPSLRTPHPYLHPFPGPTPAAVLPRMRWTWTWRSSPALRRRASSTPACCR